MFRLAVTTLLVSCWAFCSAENLDVGVVDIEEMLGSPGLFQGTTLTNSSSDTMSITFDKFSAMLDDERTGTLDAAYKKYTAQYKKEMSPDRKSVFKAALLKVFHHNMRAIRGQETFFMGINQFSDLTLGELKAKYTGSLGNPRRRNLTSVVITGQDLLNSDQELPDSMDWREFGAVTPPKDQGPCGSCVLFACTAAVESAMAIQKNILDLDLSEQQLLDCPRGPGIGRCDGNDHGSMYEYMQEHWQVAESEYEYEAEEGTCRPEGKMEIAKVEGYFQAEAGAEDEMKRMIGHYGPSSVTLIVNEGFQSYKSGIMNFPCDNEHQEVDHSVLVIGYGSEEGHDYWVVKNSWGTGWGDGGFIKMTRNTNICKIADDVILPFVY